MVDQQSCALCLSTEWECYIDVFCEGQQSPSKSFIIAKHTGFDLKPSTHSLVCSDCWKSVHDFHLFYCKVKSIHSEDWEELQQESNAEIYAQSDNEHQDFEFHHVGTIKAEPLEDASSQPDEDGHGTVALEGDSMNNIGRPKRRINVPHRYNPESADRKKYEAKLELTNVDVIENEEEIIQDDDDADFVGYSSPSEKQDHLSDHIRDEYDEVTNTDSKTAVAPPKKRRGRPPKRQTANVDESSADRIVAVSVKKGRRTKQTLDKRTANVRIMKPKKRGRKGINSMTSDSEQDDESDFEASLDFNGWGTPGRNVANLKVNKIVVTNSPSLRDEKIFAYIDEFTCHYCADKIMFKRFSEAKRHYNEVHCEPPFLKCPKCDKKTYTSGMFVSHMETHVDPDKCRCEVCGKMTDSIVSLKKHMRSHQVSLEENFPFPCRQCSRRFEVEGKRDKHELLHVPKPVVQREYGRDEGMLAFYKRIYCDLCEETKKGSTSFDNFWDLKVHMNKQHKKSPYLKCPICFKKMAVRHQIMMHIDVHKNPELYRCQICAEIHQHLDRHMISAHTPSSAAPEKKTYNCEHCGRTFRFQWKLKYHINESHGVKDVSCDVCNKFFTRPALAAHKRKAHIEGKPNLLCDHCPKMYVTQHALRAHIAFAHENRRKLSKCKLCAKEVSCLSKHMRMVHPAEGPVTCDLCGKRFRGTFHMMRHRANTCAATMESRPFKCELCGKGFSLKLTLTEHMTTHTRTSLYQCAFCLKTYGYISNLQKHRKKAHPLEWQEVQADHSIVTVIPVTT